MKTRRPHRRNLGCNATYGNQVHLPFVSIFRNWQEIQRIPRLMSFHRPGRSYHRKRHYRNYSRTIRSRWPASISGRLWQQAPECERFGGRGCDEFAWLAFEWAQWSPCGTYCLHGAPFTFFSNLDNTILTLSSKIKRLTLPVVDAFIADLKDAVREAKVSPSGSGTMVAVYGTSFISIFFFSFLHFGVGPFASFLPHFKFICIASYLFGADNNRTGRSRVPVQNGTVLYLSSYLLRALGIACRQSSASVRFDADSLVPPCSCRPRIVRINDSLYVGLNYLYVRCFFSPLRLDFDFPHGLRRLRFSPFLSPYFQSLTGVGSIYLRPCLLTNQFFPRQQVWATRAQSVLTWWDSLLQPFWTRCIRLRGIMRNMLNVKFELYPLLLTFQ